MRCIKGTSNGHPVRVAFVVAGLHPLWEPLVRVDGVEAHDSQWSGQNLVIMVVYWPLPSLRGKRASNGDKFNRKSFAFLLRHGSNVRPEIEMNHTVPRLLCVHERMPTKSLFFLENLDKFLIVAASPAQLRTLLAYDRLGEVYVSIIPHKSFKIKHKITWYKITWYHDLLLQSDKVLPDNLEWWGVHFVWRVYRRPNNNRETTGTFVLAFEGDYFESLQLFL